jgi:hypothetical protein
MIAAVERIKAASVDPTLRQAANETFKRMAQTLFDPHDERNGNIRTSDAGKCVRAVWYALHVAPEVFTPEVQLGNLDEGSLTGCWHACLLAAALEADGYHVELEPEVAHNGTPGHIDVFYSRYPPGMSVSLEQGVIELKKTHWPRGLTPPDQRAPYQVLQLMKYCAAKGVEDGAIVTVGFASADKMREDWYKLSDWMFDVATEFDRLSAALGDQEPVEDAKEAWRCKGCPVLACERNPKYIGKAVAV